MLSSSVLFSFLFVQPPDCFFLFASFFVQLSSNVSCVSSSSVMFRVTPDSLFSSVKSFSLFAYRNSTYHPLLPGGRIRPKSLKCLSFKVIAVINLIYHLRLISIFVYNSWPVSCKINFVFAYLVTVYPPSSLFRINPSYSYFNFHLGIFL
jgi:hypothetical protein